MNSVVNRLRHVMNPIVMGGVREDHDVDIIRKVKMMNVISLVGIIALITLGYSAFTKGNPWLGFFDFAVALVLSANQIHLRTTGKQKWSIYSGLVCTGGLFFFLFYTGGVDHSGHLWLYTFPLFSFFMLGSKKGMIATFLLLGFILLALSINDGQSMTIYTVRFKIRVVASMIVLVVYAYFFESTRKEAQVNLTVKNTELEQKIVEVKVTAKALKQTKETAETANRAKSEFLANMSHELRTPLNHIIGFTELVVDKNFGDLNKTQEEYLNDALHSSKHLLSLINDILDLSKVEAGKLELEPEEVNPKMLLENSLIMIKEKALKHGIRLSKHIDDGIPEIITADERKLKQVMYNLLSNAVKFTQDGGEIRLEANLADGSSLQADYSMEKVSNQKPRTKEKQLTASQKFVRISVTDSGIGIKHEDLERIFNPFEQVESSVNRSFQGTGLGLSLTKSLVKLHGGKLWAESRGAEKGSAFRFIIPIQV